MIAPDDAVELHERLTRIGMDCENAVALLESLEVDPSDITEQPALCRSSLREVPMFNGPLVD